MGDEYQDLNYQAKSNLCLFKQSKHHIQLAPPNHIFFTFFVITPHSVFPKNKPRINQLKFKLLPMIDGPDY